MTTSAGMSPEQLRETIVQATIPLVSEWDAVTTAQIALAAGIDEATLAGVFEDRDAALTAALHALIMTAMDPTQVLRDLRSVSLEQSLAARLVEAVGALDTYHGRLVTVLAPLDAGNQRGPVRVSGSFDGKGFRAVARMDVICEAVTRLLEPDQEHLRLSAAALADAFLGLYAGRQRTPHPSQQPAAQSDQSHLRAAQPDQSRLTAEQLEQSRLPAEQIVDLFLHGALTTAKPA